MNQYLLYQGAPDFQNIYIHGSLDKSTYHEKEQDLNQYSSSNVFFSYQAAPNENIDSLDFNKIIHKEKLMTLNN